LKQKHKDIYVHVYEEKEIVYSNQTGKFPTTSSRGNKYLVVLYYMDGSYIMMEPIKSRHENEMIRVHNILIERIKTRGFHPKKQMLDNEISKAYQKAIENHGMEVEKVPKEAHGRNAAEKTIQTAKNHLKAILAGCDKSFPMHLWDRLLPQAELTCNLLRPANANPNISAHQYVHGNHDYDKHPLHPLGCKVQAINDTKTCRSWEENSKDGYYIGTSMQHHRTYNVWIKATRAIQNTDTVYFQHAYIMKPTVTKADIVAEAATKLIEVIKGNYAAIHNETELDALKRLSQVFIDATKKLNAREIETTPGEQVPRVKKHQISTEPTPRVHKERDDLPHLIPSDDSDDKTSDDKTNTGDDHHEPTPAYHTRAQAAKHKTFHSNVKREAILSAVEMSFKHLNPARLAHRQFPLQVLCEIARAVMDDKTGELMEYRQLMKHAKHKQTWGRAFGNEIGRLAQGIPDSIQGTNTF
jgi:hypothetical protein